jgi:membrane fusion protein, multidrug efflux system
LVVKSKKPADSTEQKKSRVKVGKLNLNKETVKDLSRDEARHVKGGAATQTCTGGEGIARPGATVAANHLIRLFAFFHCASRHALAPHASTNQRRHPEGRMNMKYFRPLLLLFVASVCGLNAGCAADSDVRAQRNDSKAAPAPTPVSVNVIEVFPTTVAGDLLVPASLSIENTAVVLAQRDGTIMQLEVGEGARVAQGQVLARLNDEEQRAELRQLEIDVNRLRIEEQQYKSLINVNRNELERELVLAKDGLTSKAEVERAQYRLDVSKSEYEKTRLATQSAEARVDAAKLELAKSIIRAPRSGTLTRRHVSQGTGVVKGDKLFEIAELSPLTVKFQVPQAEASRLSAGQVVSLSLTDERPVARARIRRIDPVADATSSTIGYLADIVADAGGLVPGLTVNVHVPRASAAASIWIPRAAFPAGSEPRTGTTTTLFVIENDRCAARQVLVNAAAGDQVEISSGLVSGERVILAPPTGLKLGDLVRAN